MDDDRKRQELQKPVVHQKNENCQVFNGPISGCVFAMPGAIVNHTAVQEVRNEDDINPSCNIIEENISSNMATSNPLSSSRQIIINKLLMLVDKGDWSINNAFDDVKKMLKEVLGQGETLLNAKDTELSEKLWHLLENGRGDRVKTVWQNLVGYFDDKKLFKQKGSPALNRDFFGTEEGYPNIDKGRPSRNNMSNGFREVLPLLDKFCPKIR